MEGGDERATCEEQAKQAVVLVESRRRAESEAISGTYDQGV